MSNWVKTKVEDLASNGYKANVSGMGLKNEDGSEKTELRFGTLTEKEMNVLRKYPEAMARPDETERNRMIGIRMSYERIVKIQENKDISWEDFTSLDASFLDGLVEKMLDAMGVGLKN